MKHANPESALHILKNDRIVVGLLPQAGGRIVLLRSPDGDNLLFADSEQWLKIGSILPQPSVDSPWVAFMGHIMWVGPQSGFWNQQKLDESKKDQPWPPDPWMEYGNYSIIEQSESSVTLEGPESPVTGLKITKTVSIEPSGQVNLKTEAVNTRKSAVSWDLWSNTRFPPLTPFFVPVKEANNVRNDNLGQVIIPYFIEGGLFTYAPSPDPSQSIQNKAFMQPSEPWIAALTNGKVFIKSFDQIPLESIHPEHSAVEIYMLTPSDENPGLLELEAHGEYKTLQPGETMSWTETWTVLDYAEEGGVKAGLAALKDYQAKKH